MNIDKNNYIVASIHREENVENNKKFYNIINCFKKISKIYKKKIIFSLHPRSKKKIKSLKINLNLENIYFSKPFGFFDYLKLQKNSFCTISDSGTISEESYLLKFPAISLRNNNERPEAIDSGTLITSGLKDKTIIESVKLIDKNRKKYLSHNTINDYEVSNVSSVAVKSIFTFVDYINRTVWNKQ